MTKDEQRESSTIERLKELHHKLHEGSGLPGGEFNEYQTLTRNTLPTLLELYDAANRYYLSRRLLENQKEVDWEDLYKLELILNKLQTKGGGGE